MRKIKTILPILLIALMSLACISIVSNAISTKVEYNACLAKADKAAQKEISVDVDDAYAEAIDVKETPEIYLKWAQYYYGIEDYSQGIQICETAVSTFPKNSKLYTLLMKGYAATTDYESFFTTYKKCTSIGATDKTMLALYEKNKYAFQLDFDYFGEAYPFSAGVARVSSVSYVEGDEKLYGYVSRTGSLDTIYKSAGDFNAGDPAIAPVVNIKGQAYYITKEGNRKVVINPKGVTVKELGVYNSGRLSVFDGSKYYLCDIDSNIIAGPFDYVSTINDNIGVAKVGDKWIVINQNGKQIIDQSFSGAIVDSRGIAFKNGIFVKIDNQYYLIDKKGNKLSNESYDDAELFVDGYAAVKKNNKWGFIDEKGRLVIDYAYHNAHSFSNGFAAVMMNDRWGYIVIKDDKPVIVIDYQFEDAVGFSTTSKVSLVKVENNWRLLKLYL